MASAALTKLKKMQKEWKKAEAKEGAVQVDDGTYTVKVESAAIGESKAGRLQAEWVFKILNTEFAGRTIRKWDGLEDLDNLEWFKGSLVRLDVDPPEDITEIPEILEALEGTGIEVNVVTRDGFQNVYFNEAVDLSGIDEEEGEEEDEVDLESMSKDELIEYAEENDIEINAKSTASKIRAAIEEALEEGEDEEEEEPEEEEADEEEAEDEEGEEEEGDDEEEEEELDVSTMKKSELLALIEEDDLDIDPDGMTLKELREAVADCYE